MYYSFFLFYQRIRWCFLVLAATFIGAKFLGQLYWEMLKSWETESFDWNRHLNGPESWGWQWMILGMSGRHCSQEMRYWLISLLTLSSHFPLWWFFPFLLYPSSPPRLSSWWSRNTIHHLRAKVSKHLLSICSANALFQEKDVSLRGEQGGRKVKN